MKRSFFAAIALVVVVVLFANCKKGDTGPAGTANVIYSPWFTASPWIKDTVFSIWGFKFNQAAPGITQNVLDSGTVLTFGKLVGYNPSVWPANQVSQLPINLTYVSGSTTTDTWSALLSLGNLRIRFVNDKNTYTSIATNHQFRYIIIPGGKPGARMAQRSYEEICREYNIPE